jgi:hypothetical protein
MYCSLRFRDASRRLATTLIAPCLYAEELIESNQHHKWRIHCQRVQGPNRCTWQKWLPHWHSIAVANTYVNAIDTSMCLRYDCRPVTRPRSLSTLYSKDALHHLLCSHDPDGCAAGAGTHCSCVSPTVGRILQVDGFRIAQCIVAFSA